MARAKSKVACDVRVRNNPNCKRYKDTNYYVSIMGDIYKEYPNVDRKLTIWLKKQNGISAGFRIKINGKEKSVTRLVWETFKGEVPNGYCLIHKNGMKSDNALTNLKLISLKECGHKFGGKTRQMKYVINLDTGEKYKGSREASVKIGYHIQHVRDICNSKIKNPQYRLAWVSNEIPYPPMEEL